MDGIVWCSGRRERESGRSATGGRTGQALPKAQNASALMTSPPAIVPRARQVGAVDAVLDEPDAAVAEEDVDAAGVVAPGGDRREGRPALLLALAGEVEVERLPSWAEPDGPLVRRSRRS